MRGETVPFPDYSFYPTAQLIVAFAAGPARYREAIQGLSEDQIRARPRGADSMLTHPARVIGSSAR